MCANMRLQGQQSFQKAFSLHGKETCSGIKYSPNFQAFHMETSLFANIFPLLLRGQSSSVAHMPEPCFGVSGYVTPVHRVAVFSHPN